MKGILEYILAKPAGIFLLFIVVTLLLRLFSFFPVLMDHDESTYLEIAREMLGGKMLYVDVIDIKPPGIFLIYAFLQLVFGKSIFLMRLIVAMIVALTSFMIFKTSQLFIPNKRMAIAGGLIYIFFVSTWTKYGVSPNIEIFFNVFTISSLYVLLKRDHWMNFLGAGILMGVGFIIKYVVLFDFAAFLFFILLRAFRRSNRIIHARLLVELCLSCIGLLVPFAIINLYYLLTGHFLAYAEIAYFAVARYPKEMVPWDVIQFVLAFYLFFFPIHLMYFYALFNKSLWRQIKTDLPVLSVIWVVFALVSIIFPGNSFDHYFIQLMLPVSLLAGAFFLPTIKLPVILTRLTQGTPGLTILLIAFLVIFGFSVRDYFNRNKIPMAIAEYLRPRLQAEDGIYIGNYYQILYYLLDKDSPTPYIHSSLLNSPRHRETLEIDLEKESRRIFDSKPLYILVQRQGKNYPVWIDPFLSAHYVVEKQFEKRIFLYRNKDP